MNRSQIIALQSHVGTDPDGFWGRKSVAACQAHLRALMPKTSPWPGTSESQLTKFYGSAGDEGRLTNLKVTGLGVKYDGQAVRTVRVHEKLADSLLRILTALAASHPEILAQYAGTYNFRKMRGGRRYSLHARGAAGDFAPATNGNRTAWPTAATMPISVMETFAREGWIPAGAFWGRDAMHFQATQ